MRSKRFSMFLFVPILPVLLAGCEDGPTQTYQPSPDGAGDKWNNGNTPPAVDSPAVNFNAAYGGTSKTEICSGAELQQQWARMVEQPIVPPYHIAGVDLSGINYSVLTVEQAEKGINGMLSPVPGAKDPPTRLCQGQNLGSGGNGGDIGGSLVTGWGNNAEFIMEWAVPTHKAYFLQINPGYVGSMDWKFKTDPAGCPKDKTYVLDDKEHTYHWQLGKPITKDGQVFTLDWNGYGTPGNRFYCEADELYRGLTSSFAPELYDNLPAGTLCKDTGRCPVFPTGNDFIHPILGFRTISMYWDMGPPSQPQPSGSTPHDAYFFNIKYAPYSPSVSYLKLDATGPIAFLDPIGDQGKKCNLHLGGTFGELTDNCIKVFKDSKVGDTAMAKVLGNLAHDDQDFTFSVVGINQNYRKNGIDLGGKRQFDVIHDSDTLEPDDFAGDFTLDVRANGAILNDRYPKLDANGNPIPGVYSRDNHGAGAIWREYGRMVQRDLAQRYAKLHGTKPRDLHDPACLFPPGNVFPPGESVNTWKAAPGCTGFEAWIDEAYPNVWANTEKGHVAGEAVDPKDATATDPDNLWDIGSNFGNISNNGMRPGTPYALFCMDPGVYNYCGSPTLYGQSAPLLDASYQQVLQIMGNGDPLNLPPGVGDYRYFLQMFTKAYAKYMESGASMYLGQHVKKANPDVPGSIPGPVPYFGDYPLNTDDFFFDSYGGNANSGEFIQFTNADKTHDPTGLHIAMLLIGTNLQHVHYYRRLDREERALFNAMEQADARTAGQASWALLRDKQGNIVKDEWGHGRKNANIFLTNMAGSPAIANAGAWNAPTDANGNPIPVGTPDAYDPCFPETPPDQVMKTPWYCATHLDADCVGAGAQAPTDDDGNILTRENGEPILSGYCGIWNPTQFALGTSNIKLTNADWSLDKQTYTERQEIEVPVLQNPYDATSKALDPIRVLVPWKPIQSGTGFPVAVNGQNDVFVNTAQLDFVGQVVTPVVDYLPVTVTPDKGEPYQAANILAYESQDFLGDVFLCYDTVTAADRVGTGRPGDILAVHMYTPVQEIIDWLQKHPTARDQCQIIVRYSPYNNYPDYITSLANGVRVGVDVGGGFGRVTDVTLFTPGVGAPAPP
jgi:hypothetical protein